MKNHTRTFAEAFFETEDQAIIVATYIYIQKSSKYSFQRMTYSMHQNRPLLKPMILTSTSMHVTRFFISFSNILVNTVTPGIPYYSTLLNALNAILF